MSKLSVVINALNEAKDLPRAIGSVKDLADEVVVVDMESEDGSREVAKKLGAKVFTHKRLSYVEPARNFGISKATGDWILILDVDEEIPQGLVKKIKELIKKPAVDYYKIPRKNIVFGKWLKYSRWWPDYNVRLFKKGAVSWNEIIHAVPMTQGVGFEVEPEENLAIIHNHYNSIEAYLEHMGRYTSVQSEHKIKDGYKFNWRDLVGKPAGEFFSRYFYGEGYKDGIHGLALSSLQAFSELVLYLKVWQKDKFKEEDLLLPEVISEIKNKGKEFSYWKNDAMYKSTGNLAYKLWRKLKV